LPDTKLFITIISDWKTENDYKEWLNLSEARLADAYDENEPEYSFNMLKEVNQEYE